LFNSSANGPESSCASSFFAPKALTPVPSAIASNLAFSVS